jgi:hypothetical protein
LTGPGRRSCPCTPNVRKPELFKILSATYTGWSTSNKEPDEIENATHTTFPKKAGYCCIFNSVGLIITRGPPCINALFGPLHNIKHKNHNSHPFLLLFFPSSSISLSSILSTFRLLSFLFSLISLHPFHMWSIVSLSSHSTFSPQVLPVVSGFFDSFPSFLLVCGFVSFTQLYIHPSSFCFQSFRFFTGKPVSSQFHSFSSLFLFLLLNTIIFVFSTFTSSFFFLTYFHRLFIISFISLSLFATITKFLPTTLPSACAFFTISSISATCIVNSRGLSGHPCLTPFVVSPSLLYLS